MLSEWYSYRTMVGKAIHQGYLVMRVFLRHQEYDKSREEKLNPYIEELTKDATVVRSVHEVNHLAWSEFFTGQLDVLPSISRLE